MSSIKLNINKVIIILFVSFLVIFPKGGIKIYGVPLTWGYFLICLSVILIPLNLLTSKYYPVNKNHLLIYLFTLPLQIYCAFSFLFLGFDGLGFAIAFIFTFFLLPFIFFILWSKSIKELNVDFLFKYLRLGIFSIALYGIFLFFLKFLTGYSLEVPYLTVNSGDVGSLENKYNDRGGIFKLISTYNNGNLYGICILMLLPLYNTLEKNGWKRNIIKLSLLLTLSRTVWIGLLISMFLKSSSKKLNYNRILLLTSTIILIFFILYVILSFVLKRDLGFLLDGRLGGRLVQFNSFDDIGIISNKAFKEIAEIVYLSFLNYFGIIGFILFLICILSPLFIYKMGGVPKNEITKSIYHGISIYLIISFSDGAILYIPVMVIYWFLCLLLTSGNHELKTTSISEVSHHKVK